MQTSNTADIRYQLEMNHGPAQILGRYFLLAYQVGLENGIRLSVEPVEMLSEVQQANQQSWPAMFQGLDVRYANIDERNAFCVIGRNGAGEIVATQGCRLYDFSGTSFKDAAEDMSFWYADPKKYLAKGDRCAVHAWAGRQLTGRAVYSGATWVRPDCRGKHMVQILPRLIRAAGMAKWGPAAIFGIMAEPLVKGGLLRHNGFRNHEWSVELISSTVGNHRFKFLWEKPDDLAEDLTEFLDGAASEAAQSETARRAEKKALAS